jgi:hypothetical protein
MIQPNRRLTSPVLDQVTRNLFIGDPRGLLSMVNADTPGAPVTLAVGLFPGQNPGIADAPLVDALNGTVFATSSDDGTSAVVVQADTTTLAQLARTRIGGGSTLGPVNVNLYDGAFDNNYFNDPETGFLLVCGTGVADTSPWRYAFGFTGRVLNTGPSASGQIVSSLRARCSPITEFFNPNIGGGTDFFFWGLTADCSGPSTQGCVISFTVPGGLTRVDQPGGTSAIVIDNVSTDPQASSIYFTDQGGPRRAVKLTQNGLQ